MKELSQSRIATTLTLLIGAWVTLSAMWITMSAAAQTSTYTVGVIIVAASIAQFFVRSTWPSWINGIAAVWLFLSMFFYGMSAAAVWSAVISAIAIAIIAVWDGLEIENYSHHHHIASM
jgi:hypothetical protein